MAKKKALPKFQLTARIVLIVQKDIESESLETAVAIGKTLGIDDFVEFEEGFAYEDASCLVTGVSDFDKHYSTE